MRLLPFVRNDNLGYLYFGHLDLFRNSDFVLRIYILILDP